MQIHIAAFSVVVSVAALACSSESTTQETESSPQVAGALVQTGEWRACTYTTHPWQVSSRTYQASVSGAHVRFTTTQQTSEERFYEGDFDSARHLVATYSQKNGDSTEIIRGYFSADGRRFSGDSISIDPVGNEYRDDAFVMFVNDGAASCPDAP